MLLMKTYFSFQVYKVLADRNINTHSCYIINGIGRSGQMLLNIDMSETDIDTFMSNPPTFLSTDDLGSNVTSSSIASKLTFQKIIIS